MSGDFRPCEGKRHDQEVAAKSTAGMPVLLLNILLMLLAIASFVFGVKATVVDLVGASGIAFIAAGLLYLLIIGPIIFVGLKVLKPNEALVLTLFGRYYGTLRGEGFFFVHPFTAAVNPASSATSSGIISLCLLYTS